MVSLWRHRSLGALSAQIGSRECEDQLQRLPSLCMGDSEIITVENQAGISVDFYLRWLRVSVFWNDRRRKGRKY